MLTRRCQKGTSELIIKCICLHVYMGIKSDISGLAKTFGTKWVKKVSFSCV